jgi:hypothetical protein
LSHPSGRMVNEGRLLINARVESEPENLHAIVQAAANSVAAAQGVSAKMLAVAHFAPPRPEPTYRLTGDDGRVRENHVPAD